MNKVDLKNETINGVHSYFLEYYNKIFNFGWVAGQELKDELQNLYEDLLTDEYEYNTEDVNLKIRFAEEFCKQTKSKKFNGKTIKYMLWQKARKEVTYSFYIAGTNLQERRFNEVLELVARKNGKSTDKASECATDLFIGEGGLGICCSSNDDSQANLIFNEIKNMIEATDPKQKYIKRVIAKAYNKKNKSEVFKISDKTKNKEGRNISTAYIDEAHEMTNNVIYMSITQSTGVVENPLVYIVTTEGVVNDGFLDHKLVYARKVIKGEIDDIHFLPWLYTQDSELEVFENPNSWWKSNPGMTVIKKQSYLADMVKKAQDDREQRNYILCKDFNIKQTSALSWLELSEVESTVGEFSLEDFKNSYCLIGIDLSDTTDLTSVDFMFVRDNKTYFYNHCFVTKNKAESVEGLNDEKKDYYELERQGFVTVLENNVVDTKSVREYIWSIYEQYKIRPFKVGYDNWGAKDLVNDLKEDFGDDVPWCVRMNPETLNQPMKTLSADIRDGKVNCGNNPLSKWCLLNTAIFNDKIGRIMPTKKTAEKRIDATLTKIICYNLRYRYFSSFEEANNL